MSLICISLSLLLLQSGLNEATANAVPNDEIAAPQFQNIGRQRPSLITLYDDVMILIIQNLDFYDFYQLAETNPKFIPAIDAVIRQKYRNYELFVTDDQYRSTNWNIVNNNTIEIYENDMSSKVLQHFAHSFQRIRIGYFKTSHVHKLTNELASDTLYALSSYIVKEDTLVQYQKPFAKVVDFNCFMNSKQSGNYKAFDQVFPKLESLSISMSIDTDYSFIDCEYPHLKALYLAIGRGARNQLHSVEGLLRKNSHIREFLLNSFQGDYIKVANQLLPNIEKLILYDFDIGSETIEFKNVKDLDARKLNRVEKLEQLSFPQLESLSIDYQPRDFETFNRTFTKYPLMKNLYFHLTGHYPMASHEVEQLFAKFPNLNEMTLECNGHIETQYVIRIIQNHQFLTKITLMVYKIPNTFFDVQTVHETFKNEWNISEFEYHNNPAWIGLSFIKKN